MENENTSKNFIEMIIDKDLSEGHCDEVHTRFPPEFRYSYCNDL